MTQNNSQYSNRWSAILTMTGVAVGLGNVWRFPYMMGSYGGSAFLLIYLIFTLVLAFPALYSEMSLGQQSKSGTIGAFEFIMGKKLGKYPGYLFVVAVTIAASYYAVVVGNVFFSSVYSLFRGFSEQNNPEYHRLLDDGLIQYGSTTLLIISGLMVSYKGLSSGIERISKLIMPFFLISILYMIFHSWMMPGAVELVWDFLRPDFKAIGSTEIFAALGQSFFSIGLGGTFVVVYASYIGKKEEVGRISIFTCLGDVGSSLLVSLFLVPSLLLFGLKMDSGPSLLFQTLPELFSQMPGGRWVGTVFLVALFLVAFLSLIAAFQVPVDSLQHLNISRNKFYLTFGILQMLLSFPSVLFPSLIGMLDMIVGSGMQVLGSMCAVIGVWWGIQKSRFRELIPVDSRNRTRAFIELWLKWLVPASLLAILIAYIYDTVAQ